MANTKVHLFIDSASPVKISPEWSTLRRHVKHDYEGRSDTGKRLVYRHGSHQEIRIPVRFVNSADRSIINSWWFSEASLFIFEENATSGTSVFSCHITNPSRPAPTAQSIYDDQFGGVIMLEGVFDQLAELPLTEPPSAPPAGGFPDPWTDTVIWADDQNWVETL